MQGVIEQLEIRRIIPPRHSLRSELGQLSDLSESIMEAGLLSPIVVRPVEDQDKFEIVAGNRRFEACKKLGMSRVPCYISSFDDKGAYEASLIENIQRKTLNPLEEATAFKKYVDELGYGSESELAKRIGKSPSYVSRRVALLRLSKTVQAKLLRSAKVGMAEELLALDDDEAQEAVTDLIVQGKLTTSSDVRRLVKTMEKSGNLSEFSEEILPPIHYSPEEMRERSLNRMFIAFITALQLCLMRLDDVINALDDNEWVVKEPLMQNRRIIHRQIDRLIKLRRKAQLRPPPM